MIMTQITRLSQAGIILNVNNLNTTIINRKSVAKVTAMVSSHHQAPFMLGCNATTTVV